MTIQVRYFAAIREALGTSGETLDTTAATVAELRALLASRGSVYADTLSGGRAVRVAVNQVLSPETAAVPDGAEVAFFPPVTGG